MLTNLINLYFSSFYKNHDYYALSVQSGDFQSRDVNAYLWYYTDKDSPKTPYIVSGKTVAINYKYTDSNGNLVETEGFNCTAETSDDNNLVSFTIPNICLMLAGDVSAQIKVYEDEYTLLNTCVFKIQVLESIDIGMYEDEQFPVIGFMRQATDAVLGGIKAASKTSADTVPAKIDAATGILYVEPSSTYELPQATDAVLGGIKATAKTSADTVPAKIDAATGILYVEPSSVPVYTYSYDGTNKIHILTGSGTFGQVDFLTQYVSSTDTMTINGTTVTGIYLGGLIAQTLRPSFYSFVYNGSSLYFQTSAVYNSLDQTSSGFALDARQGKTLNDAITTRGIPTGGTTGQALIKSSATDYETDWATVGRTNPNLLINRNLAVNQIDSPIGTAFAANGYIADCWQAWGGNVTLLDGGGVILASGVQLMQRFEIYYVKLLGKTYTLSLKIGGVIKTATITFPSAVAGANTINTLAVAGVGTLGLGFLYTGGTIINDVSRSYVPCVCVTSSSTIQIDDAYLEPGSLSTLAHAPEMDYSQELLKCQRYYRTIGSGAAYYYFAQGVFTYATVFSFRIPLTVEMRIAPTVTFQGNFTLTIDATTFTASSLSNNGSTPTELLCANASLSGKTPGYGSLIGANNDTTAKIIADARL